MRRSDLLRRVSELLVECGEAFRALADDEGAAIDTAEPVYSSDALPRDCRTRRAFAEHLRRHRVPGARREGRLWIVPRAAWHESRRAAPKLRAVPTPQRDDDELAEAALASAGLRSTTRRSA